MRAVIETTIQTTGCLVFVVLMSAVLRSDSAVLKYPAVISSTAATPVAWSATLMVEEFDVIGDAAFKTRAYCYRGTCTGCAATRDGVAWQGCSYPAPTIALRPGDNFTLTVENELPPNPAGKDTAMNSMHTPNSVNVHTHGLHIDPLVDNVFDHAGPGERKVYAYKVPENHQPGLFWYHGGAMRQCGTALVPS